MAFVGQARLGHLRLDIPPVHLGVHVSLPQLHVKQELPVVRIDVGRPLEELGLETNLTLARRAARAGREAALRYTAQKAREGDRLRDFQLGIDVVDIAKEQGRPRHKELNVDIAPKSKVEIQVEPGRVQVQLEPGRVKVEVPFRLVKVDVVSPGKSGQEKRGMMLDTYG